MTITINDTTNNFLYTLNEDDLLSFSTLNVSGAVNTVTVTLTVTNGILNLGSTTNLNNVFISGNAISFEGSESDVNNTLVNLSFDPDQDYNGSASLNISVDDGTNPIISQNVSLTINPVNDAPVLTPTSTLLNLTVNEDTIPVGAVGSLISDFNGNISDVDSVSSLKSIAITNVSSDITLYYSLDNGTNWNIASGLSDSSALLLADDGVTRIYVVNNTVDFNGTISNGLTFRAWDQTIGTSGNFADTTINGNETAFSIATDTIDITVSPTNDAPTRIGGIDAPNLTEVLTEDQDSSTIFGETIDSLFNSKFNDIDGDNLAGIAVVANGASFFDGQWQWSDNNGISWNTIESTIGSTNALVLDKNSKLRFVPFTHFNGNPDPLTVRLIDDSVPLPVSWGDRVDLSDPSVTGGGTPYSNGDNEVTITTFINGVNDAPRVDGEEPVTLTPADEDSINHLGDTVFNLFDSQFSDIIDNNTFYNGSSSNQLAGVALVQNASVISQGKWQYYDGVNWVDIANNLGDDNALVLDKNTSLRFLPSANFNGTPGTLTARLIDDSQGPVTTGIILDFNVIPSGGTSIYSDEDNVVVLNTSINAVNDSPTRDITKPNLILLADEDTSGSGSFTVETLFGSGFQDEADAQVQNGGVSTANNFGGIAIVQNEATVNGTWQWFDGTNWITIPAIVSTSNALVLDKDTLVRFVINTPNFNGDVGKLTARLLDDSSAIPISSGTILDVSTSDGTEIYSNSSNQVLLLGNITPINDAPTLNPIALMVDEGGLSTFFNVGNFNLTDIDNIPQQVIVKIASLPTKGILTFNGIQVVAGTTFSSDEISSLKYQHNGDQVLSSTSDSFNVTAEDGAGGVIGVTSIPITINPVNQLPTIASGEQTLYEGQTGVVIPVTISDPDQALNTPHSVKILSLPVRGTLKVNGNAINSIPTGGLAVSSNSIITYDHDGNDLNNGNPPNESFNIEVIDDGGGTGIPRSAVSTINLNILPNNDDPFLVNNTGTTLNMGTGRQVTITSSMLRVDDPDSSVTQLTYTLTEIPDNGYLLYNDNGTQRQLLVGATFTQAELNSGIISYRFFGTVAGNFTDDFKFQVRDSEITAYPVLREGGIYNGNTLETITFPITIEISTPTGSGGGGIDDTFPVRGPTQPPTVVTNNVLTLNEGSTNITIPNSLLKATDVDNTPAEIIFRIESLPTSGILRLNGNALRILDSFTQKDIDDGKLTFDHDGNEDFIDNFKFTISDGSNVVTNSGNPFIFDIDVTPVNDSPAINVSGKPFLREGGSTGIAPDSSLNTYISLSDVDGSGEKSGFGFATINTLTFQVTTLPTHGYLEVDQGSGFIQITDLNKASINITQAQLNGDLFRYVHNGTENFSDRFDIQANDNTGTLNELSSITTVDIDIAPINDPPVFQEKKNLIVLEGATATIKGFNGISGDESRLVYTDADNSTIQRQYLITTGVEYGTLFLNGNALGIGSVFSQDDLDKNLITYKHDGSENHDDQFLFTVRDGAGGDVPGSYQIKVTPRNDAPTLTTPGVQTFFGTAPINIKGIIPADIDLLNLNTSVPTSPEVDRVRITLNPQLISGTTFADGALTLNTITGVTFINPTTGLPYSNQNSTNNGVFGNKLVIEGTLADVTNALDSLQYQVNRDVNGTISLQVTVDDRLYSPTTGAVIGANGGNQNQTGLPFSDEQNTVTRNILIATSNTNDAPEVIISSNSSVAFLREDQISIFNGKGGNPPKITIKDLDAFDTNNNIVTLTVSTGTISLSNVNLITAGANGTDTITLTGSLSNINKTLEGLSYTPPIDYNNYTNSILNPPTLTIVSNDNGNSGVGGPQETTRVISLLVRAVNDAPTRIDADPVTSIAVEDVTNSRGDTVFSLFNPKFNDVRDDQIANNGSAPNTLAGVAIVDNSSTNPAQGQWQWSSNGTSWTNISTSLSLNNSLLLSSNSRIRFLPAADFHGTPTGGLTTRLIDTSRGAVSSGTLLNLSASNDTGGTTRFSDSSNQVLLQGNVTPVNDAPVATSGTISVATVSEDTSPSGTQLLGLLNSRYDDTKDNQTANNGNNTATDLSYVAIVGSTNYIAGQGTWQYSDGSGGWIDVPVNGLSNNSALIIPSDREIRFLSASNFFGTPGSLTVKLADNSSVLTTSISSSDLKNLTNNGGIGTTGSWSVNNVTINTTVNNINDAPSIDNANIPVTLTAVDEDTTNPVGATVSSLFGSKYNDTFDNQQSISGGGKADTNFAGIAIVGDASTSSQGTWEYNTGSGWVTLPSSLSDTNALVLAPNAQLRFLPAANYYGDPGELTIRVSDGTGFTAGVSQDISSIIGTQTNGSGGWSNDTTTLETVVNSVNDAPVLSGTNGLIQTTVEDDNPLGVGTNLNGISDIEIGLNQLPDLVTATVTIGNFFAGDQLAFTLPSGVTATANGTGDVYTLSGSSASLANILSALQSTTYVSSSQNPTNIDANGVAQNPTRTIAYQINDTQGNNNLSNIITTTVEYTGIFNDAPSLGNASFSINEDPTTNNGQTINTFFNGLFSDPDGVSASLSGLGIISNTADATTQGAWQYSTDGTNWFDVGTVNDTGTALALSKDTLVRFVPVLNYNGTPPALGVRGLDDTYNAFTSGSNRTTLNTTTRGGTTAIAADPSTLTVTVNAINDAPAISGTTDTRTYTENDSSIILVTASGQVFDVDTNNFPGGNITVSLNNYVTGDVLSVNNQGTGANQIGLSGNNVTFSNTIIGTTSGGNANNLVITFNSNADKTAIQTLLDNLTYGNSGDNPTDAGANLTRTFNVTLNDGGNIGQGNTLNSNTLTGNINIIAVNDAPVNTVPVTQTTLEDTTRIFNTANGNLISISDADAGNQPVTVTLTSTNGIINLSGISGLTFENSTTNGSNNIQVRGTIADINNALNNLSFVPTANYNDNFITNTGTGSITITTDDLGNTNNNGGTKLIDTDTITINITPVNDAPIVSLINTPVTGNYTEGLTPFNVGQNIGAIADVEIDQNEPNVANNFTGTVTITDFFTGDVLDFTTVGTTGVTVNNQGNGVYTVTGGTKANVLQVLKTTTYSSTSPNPSNYNTNLDRVIQYQINDNQLENNLSNIVSTTVNIAPVNDPPTVSASNGVTTFTEGNNVTSTPVAVDSNLTLDDVDNLTLASALVSITGNLQNLEDVLVFTANPALYGNITGSYNSTTGVLTLNSLGQTATLAQWQNALRSVTYTNSSQIPNNGDRNISISINDGTDTSNITTKTVQVVPVNDTPILGTGSTVNYFENATAVAIALTMTLTNADTDLLGYNNGSSLTIAYTSGATPADQLSIASTNGITVSGNNVLYNSNIIGTFSGGVNGTDLTITFNGTFSSAIAVKQLLNNISFNNTSEDPVSGNRVFNIIINDNEGGLQTATSSTTVNVIPVNDAPTLTSTPQNPNYIEDTVAFSTIFNGSVTDTIEAGQLINQLVFTVNNVTNISNEQLSINGTTVTLTNGANFSSGGFSGTVNLSGSNATVTINHAGATQTEINNLVNGLGYKNTSQDPTAGNRVVTITSITDNGGIANGGVNNTNPNLVSTVNVIPVNDEPTLTATGATTTYTEDVVNPSSLFSVATSGTVEAGQKLKELKLTVNNLNDGNNEILRIDGQDIALVTGTTTTTTNDFNVVVGLTGNTATLTITKSGDATTDEINTLINGLGYKNNSQSPTQGDRTITITSLQDDGGVANGGDDLNNTLNIPATVNVIAVNDAPVLDATPVLSISTTEDVGVPSGAVGFLISDFVGGISDVDTGALTGIAITNKSSLGNIYYSTNNGTNWTLFSNTLSDSNALLLANNSNTRLFFSPTLDVNGTLPTGITFRAWDRTTGTNGSTANTTANGGTTAFSTATETISVNITPVNDAPTRTSASTSLTAVLEDNTSPIGATVNSLFTSRFSDTKDNQTANGGSSANTLAGVVVVGNAANSSTQGVWQWFDTTNSTWTAIATNLNTSIALVLAENTSVRFLPNANYNGTPGILTTRLIDNSAGAVTSGTTVNVSNNTTLSGGITQYSNSTNAVTLTTSITAVNDAPIASGAATLTAVNEDTTPSGATVTSLFTGNFNDSTDQVTGGSSANTLAGIAIVGNAANSTTQGNWQYFNGLTWVNVGTPTSINALIVASASNLRFLPVTDYHGAVPALTVNLIDSSITVTTGNTINLSGVGATGGTTAYSLATVNLTSTINPVNDAPTASGSVSINNISEDVTNPSGTLINTLITSSNYNDNKDNQTANGGNNTETPLSTIAVVGSTNYVAAQGTWQYGNGSGGWINIPVSGLSDTASLIIPAGRDIRFLPATDFFGTPGTLTVRLADSSTSLTPSGSSIDTKNLSSNGGIGGTGAWSNGTVTINSNGISNINDAPTINNPVIPASLANVNEDSTNPSGDTISNLFSAKYSDAIDNQTGITGGGDATTPLAGIAITNNGANSSTQGKWQYESGSGWVDVPQTLSDNSSLVLPATANLRFLPNTDFNGSPGQLTVRLSDGTAFIASANDTDLKNISSQLGGVNGWTTQTTNLTTSINPVNDAPIASASSLSIEEDTTNPSGSTVNSLFTNSFDDSTDQVTGGSSANNLAGVAIVGNVGNPLTEGTWQYFNGTNWVDVGARSSSNALIVSSTNSLRFVPVANYNGDDATLTVNLIDDSSGAVTTGNIVNLSGVGATGGTTVYSGNTVLLTSQVTPGNDPPTLFVPPLQTLGSGTSITFSQGNGNAITIDDFADLSNNGVDNFTVTLNVTNGGNPYGTLALATTNNLTVVNNGTSVVTLTGTKNDINNALNGLVYTPVNSNIDLSINLNVLVNDLGNGSAIVGQNPLTATNDISINISDTNEAPILTNTLPLSVTAIEDTPFIFNGSNLISFNDPDDFGNVMEVTLSLVDENNIVINNGTLTLGTVTGLNFTGGTINGTNNFTFRGTEAQLNAALASLSYQGGSNYNTNNGVKNQLKIQINDLGNTGTLNGILGGANIVDRYIPIRVTPVNDAPVASPNIIIPSVNQDNIDPPLNRLPDLLGGSYSDSADNQLLNEGSASTALRGMAIVGNNADSTQGKWQYSASVLAFEFWQDIPTSLSPSSALVLDNYSTVKLRFLPNPSFNGTPTVQSLEVHLSDGLGFSRSSNPNVGNLKDISADIVNPFSGWSNDSINITTEINKVNTPPVIDNLDGDIFAVARNGTTKIDQNDLATITDTQGLKTGGKLTISLNSFGVSKLGDQLSVATGSGITIASGIVSLNGTAIGTIDALNNGINGQPLTINFTKDLTVGEGNTLIQNISYTANGTDGIRSASFTVTDGQGLISNTATAFLNVTNTPTSYIVSSAGSDRSEIIKGTNGNDAINSKGANDIIYAYNGDDLLIGEQGNDRLDASSGNDILIGGAGDDGLLGGNDQDILFGGDGTDNLNSGNGNDYLNGGSGADTLTGGAGSDVFDYSNIKDSFLGRVTNAREYDLIMDFNVSQGDKILTRNPITSFNTTPINITSLTSTAVESALNSLGANSAGLVRLGSRTFLAINDDILGFNADNDTLIEFRSTGALTPSIFSPLSE